MNYTAHGTAKVAIIYAPDIFGERWAHLATKGEYSWALRDFITGQMLRSGDSTLTLTDIEKLVKDDRYAAYRSVERAKEWANELAVLSHAEFGPKYDPTTPPKSRFGTWKKL
jgi:hypothetical protein